MPPFAITPKSSGYFSALTQEIDKKLHRAIASATQRRDLLQALFADIALEVDDRARGFVETRQQLLTLKPNHRMNWIGFAVSHHLNSNASKAIDILEAYEGTLEDDYPPESERCEHGEMLLYKISLLEECGLVEKALKELRKREFKIVDKLSYKEEEVSLLVKLNSFEEGEKLYRVLLTMNPDNYQYYEGLQKCVGLPSKTGQYSSDEIDKLDALYKSLAEQYTWSSAVKRIPLDFLDGEKFREAADNYIRPLLTKECHTIRSMSKDQNGLCFLLPVLHCIWSDSSGEDVQVVENGDVEISKFKDGNHMLF